MHKKPISLMFEEFLPALGSADAEIKFPVLATQCCRKFTSVFKTWSKPEYSSFACSTYCKKFRRYIVCPPGSSNFIIPRSSLPT